MSKSQRPKTKYIEDVQLFDYKPPKGNASYSMISIPIKKNKDTGWGESWSFGVPKAKAILNNMIAIRKFVQEHEDELKAIADDAHLKQEQDE